MGSHDIIAPMERTSELPVVRTVAPGDLRHVLAKGLDDFNAMPTHVIFLCAIYPIVGLLIARLTFGYDVIPLLYPLSVGFAFIGPVAAVGLYELSRRRELGMDTSWIHGFDIFRSPSLKAIIYLSFILLSIFVVWIAIAHSIYIANFGNHEPASLMAFAWMVLTTSQGHNLIILGNAVGLLFAVIVLSLSVVSFPLLLDRNVGAPVAMITSVRTVLKNPVTMLIWGLIVVASLAIGSLPFFVGLAIVLPVLGHSTWHLYRAAIEPDPNPRPEYLPRPTPVRYGAQFPASLFAPYSYEDTKESKKKTDNTETSPGDD